MKENYKVRSPWKTFLHAKIGFPLALLSCFLFFFSGFFASMLFSQGVSSEGVGNVRRLEELGSDWPAMQHGITGDPHASSIPFQVLSWKPRALYFPNFASSEKCEAIVRLAKTKLRPSTLALRKGETEETTKGIRTSSGAFLSASQDPSGSLAWVEKKIAKVTMIPREHGEAFNVLRYELGQHYASHYDAFNPAEYGPQQSQRVASFLLYLSDVEEGGETMFPFENGANMDIGYDYEKCIGLKVKPRKGDGLLFYSLMINGTIDPPLEQ
ncbi:2-oxoglutarate (2OG) and Fe(II)-dependent oxygenase superfamily protein isoform X2 [Carex rostrata]